MAEPPNTPVSPEKNKAHHGLIPTMPVIEHPPDPLTAAKRQSRIMDRKITPTGRSTFTSVLNPPKYRTRPAPPSLVSPALPSTQGNNTSSGKRQGTSVRAIVDWLEKTSSSDGNMESNGKKKNGSVDSTKRDGNSNSTSGRPSIEKSNETEAEMSSPITPLSPVFGSELPSSPIEPAATPASIRYEHLPSANVSSTASHKQSLSINCRPSIDSARQTQISSPLLQSSFDGSAPHTPAIHGRQQQSQDYGQEYNELISPLNTRPVPKQQNEPNRGRKINEDIGTDSGVFSSSPAHTKTTPQKKDEKLRGRKTSQATILTEGRLTLPPNSPSRLIEPTSPLANIDGIEESLALGEYKTYFNNRPLARCLDDVPPILAGIPDEVRRQLEAPLVDLTPEFEALGVRARSPSPLASRSRHQRSTSRATSKTRHRRKASSVVSVGALSDLMDELANIVATTSTEPLPKTEDIPIASNPPRRPPPRTPAEANAFWNGVRSALAPSSSEDSESDDDASSCCSVSVVSFPLLLMDKLEQEQQVQQRNGTETNMNRGLSKSPQRELNGVHTGCREQLNDTMNTNTPPISPTLPLQLTKMPPPPPIPFDSSTHNGFSSPTAPFNGYSSPTLPPSRKHSSASCNPTHCTKPSHRHRHHKRDKGASFNSGTTSVSNHTSGQASATGSIRSRRQRRTTEEKMSEVNAFLTSSTTADLLMPKGKIDVDGDEIRRVRSEE